MSERALVIASWDPQTRKIRWRSPRGVVMNEPIAKKIYYSIGEVCDLTGLKPHVLRYWETQFDVLNPTKNRAGNRVFRSKEIEVILLVKHLLYEEKYTIEGANKRLIEMRKAGELAEERQDVLEPEFLSGMKAELASLKNVLTPGMPIEAD
ncbi:MAG: MerR family transcriptional regulator [Gemmatimonadetes bacterium]|nr:MerR family transcriptional regulator [Gemmatimonadota bacterium]